MDAGMGFVKKAKIDAYIKLEYKKKKYKTKTIVMEKGGPPVNWNHAFWMPAQMPVLQPSFTFNLMDYDLDWDETAGSLEFDTKELLTDPKYLVKNGGNFKWFNIYGSPLGQGPSKAKTKMNLDPDCASAWKGRVLIHILVEQTD